MGNLWNIYGTSMVRANFPSNYKHLQTNPTNHQHKPTRSLALRSIRQQLQRIPFHPLANDNDAYEHCRFYGKAVYLFFHPSKYLKPQRYLTFKSQRGKNIAKKTPNDPQYLVGFPT